MNVDLQIQIYIVAGVFGFISVMLIFFMAGICGQISKLKRQQRKLEIDQIANNTGYDNYAYNSRTIQPDEELCRRGYTMYDPNRNEQSARVHESNNAKYLKVNVAQPNNVTEMTGNGEGSRDAASEYSIANTETVVMTGNDVEMKITRSFPPEFHGIPPPPAFVNRFDLIDEENTTKTNHTQ